MGPNPFGDPQVMALLGLSQGLLAAGSPSAYPIGIGGALAKGIGGGVNGAMEAQKYNVASEQLKALQLNNALLGGKINFLGGVPGVTAGTAYDAAPASASPVVTNPEANQPFGVPISGPSAPQNQATTGAFPEIPGLGSYLSRGAALGYLSPAYVSAIASANSPTELLKTFREFGIDPNSQFAQTVLRNKLLPPVVNRGYGIGNSGPNGEYIPDPASEAQIARVEGTKAGFETVPTVINGREVPTFKSQLPGFPGSPPAAAPTPAPMQPAPSAQPQGGLYGDIPKLESPKGFGISTYEKERQSGAAKLAGDLSQKTSEAASIANERLVYNNQALSLLDQATTGSGALSIANVKNFLNARLGVPLDLMDKVVSGDANATTALNKDLLNAATQKAKQAYGSRITQSEVMLQIKQASPNVDQLTGTIRYLLQTDNAMSKYQIDKAQYLGGYLQHGGDPYQFEGFYGKKFPMSASVKDIHLPGKDMASMAQAAWGKYEPNVYEYRLFNGQLQRRRK